MPNLLPALIIGALWCGSTVLAALPWVYWSDPSQRGEQLVLLACAPPIFILSFVTLAGLLSIPAQRGIVRGKFPRQAFHPVYFLRRVYGACWTTIYYFKPLYSAVLAIPVLRRWTLFLFGYRGASQFTVYPDTWIRDLPLLKIGQGSYLSNRATIGTNLCLSDGQIYVDEVHFGEKVLVGHLAKVAPGSRMAAEAEIGVGASVGIRCKVGPKTKVGVNASLNHGAVMEEGAEIGTASYVGLKAQIGPGVKIAAGGSIPAGAVIATQSEANKYFSSEQSALLSERDRVAQMLRLMETA